SGVRPRTKRRQENPARQSRAPLMVRAGCPREFPIVDRKGRVRMVDVGDKPVTHREAVARAAIAMQAATLEAIVGGTLKKGEALAAARLAGIMAAKRTHELMPPCHHLPLQVVQLDFFPVPQHS